MTRMSSGLSTGVDSGVDAITGVVTGSSGLSGVSAELSNFDVVVVTGVLGVTGVPEGFFRSRRRVLPRSGC
jgi:hypothetical protein